MTQLAHLEALYNQFINLTEEIRTLLEDEEYDIVITKLEDKNRLMGQIALAKKTTELTKEDGNKLQLIEERIKESDEEMLSSLKKLHCEIGKELKQTNKKVKINSAYSGVSEYDRESLIDYSE